jgi:aspartate/methionine/tyrosine aminotransferase
MGGYLVDGAGAIYLNYARLIRGLGTLRAGRDDLFDWILSLGPTARYNLTSSGLSEPELRALGIDTSFERFAAEKDAHETNFAEEVAKLYHVEPGDVMVTAGGTEAIFLAYSVFGAKRAVVPLPNYPAMFTVPRALGMRVENFTTPRKLDGAILGLTDPNNPSGEVLDAATVDGLIESSTRGGGVVYINETYREFTFAASPGTHFDGSGKVLTSGTMTKFFGLGRLRVGWILADRRNRRRLLYAKWAVSGHDSEYSLWIAAQVLRNRSRLVERARRIYAGNSRLVRRFLEETQGVSADLGVAPFCLVRYKNGSASVALARKILEKTGALVSPGDFFGAPRSFRLCFTAEETTLKGGLGALSDFFNGIH